MEAMALSVAESAAKALVGKLGSMLLEEAKLLAGVEGDIRYIMDELKSMASFLRVLSSRQDHDEQVKTWMEQVREMASDAEDFIDVFSHRLRRPHDEHGFMGFLAHACRWVGTLIARHCFATDLKKLKLRARDVSDRRARYFLTTDAATTPGGRGTSSSSTATNSSDPRISALFVEDVQPLGIDDHRDKLVRWLMEENQAQLRVISLVGFGGLGKTTLAMMVYQSPAVTSGHFQTRAWIAVSQSYNIEALLRTILRQLSIGKQYTRQASGVRAVTHHDEVGAEQDLDKMGESQLVMKIRDHLTDKRYVIVLDDVWTISAWERLRVALLENRNGSRIIVTTRNETVANACCSHNHQFIYKIPPLSPELSRDLFCKRVFDGACPEDLIHPSELILNKCGGLPLAIVAIAGVLAAKPKKTPEEWQKLHEHLGSELETNPSLEGMNQVLTLSYNDLPYHLKLCLLYLSIFPEDYEIDRKRLLRRWMAEGLVGGRRGMSPEEVAEGYFNELMNRSLIQPAKVGVDGKVKTCRVHDIMLELIVSISMEENFVTMFDEHSTSISGYGNVRRVSLHEGSMLKRDLDLSHVRSLTTFGPKRPLLDYGNMTLLRVLDLQECRRLRNDDLNSISKLFLLNYLSVKSTSVSKLPASIGNLRNLRFLDTRGTRIHELPHAVVKLQRLAYLLGNALRLPKGIGNIKGLAALGEINAARSHSAVLREIGELTQLEKLNIDFGGGREKWGIRLVNHKPIVGRIPPDYIREREQLRTSLEKLDSCLRSLKLLDHSDDGEEIHVLNDLSKPPLLLRNVYLHGPIRNLPAWFASLDEIAKITLEYTYLDDNAIQVLKNLPTLVQLVLGVKSFKEESEEEQRIEQGQLEEEEARRRVHLRFGGDGFKGLRILKIHSLGVIFEEGALPILELLKLYGYMGKQIMSGVHHLLKLKEFYFDYFCAEAFKDMLKVYKHIQTIPNLCLKSITAKHGRLIVRFFFFSSQSSQCCICSMPLSCMYSQV